MTTATIQQTTEAFQSERHLIAGRYRINARIGKGRLGEIFAATDERFEKLGVEQHAAVQIIPESVVGINKIFNKLSLGYTMLKAGAHPNIVNCMQFGRDGKFGFIAMELLEGASLRVVLESEGALPADEVKPVLRGIGAALAHLHAKDIVHGNLTTSNVFVSEDLEARLLDVVPMDAGDAIFRGVAMSEPFSRCTAQDDVFGLACLAYEMLSGKHPFNHCSPGDARLAGLEAERIASLTDSEWNALRSALSFERDERTSTVTGFMRDFGILGTERLRPVVEQAEAIVEVAAPVQNIAPVAPAATVADVDPFSWNVDGMPDKRPTREGRHYLRTTFLGILLAGLIGWMYYGEPQETFASAIGYVDETMQLGLVASSDVVPLMQIAAPVQAVIEEIDLPVVEEPVTETVLVEEVVAEIEAPIEETLPVETPIELLTVPNFVTVSERDAAARIELQHNTNSTMQLTWWTRQGTAVSDQDFIAGEQRITIGAAHGDNNIIHIPLVNDSVREPDESFFVNLELRNSENGNVEQFATVRVDVTDDD